MIDHIGVRGDDIAAASEFHDAVVAALGHDRTYADPDLVSYASPDRTFFWLQRAEAARSATRAGSVASDRGMGEAFHTAGPSAGGRDNGAPGLGANRDPSCFAAFLLEPDGNNVEAVCTEEAA